MGGHRRSCLELHAVPLARPSFGPFANAWARSSSVGTFAGLGSGQRTRGSFGSFRHQKGSLHLKNYPALVPPAMFAMS